MEWTLLASVPAADRDRLVAIARRRSFKRGEVVFHQHDPGDSLHLVSAGRFAISARTELGEESLLAIRFVGEVFGELALVADGRRTATVEALEPSETLAVYRDDFETLRTARPQIDRLLVVLLAHQLAQMDVLLSEAHHVSAERRVLRRLLDAAEAYGGAVAGTEVALTQQQLASLAGASRPTVNAVLARERRRGTIDLHRGRVAITNPAALARNAGLRGAWR